MDHYNNAVCYVRESEMEHYNNAVCQSGNQKWVVHEHKYVKLIITHAKITIDNGNVLAQLIRMPTRRWFHLRTLDVTSVHCKITWTRNNTKACNI